MKTAILVLMSALVGCSSGSASEDTEAPSQYTEATSVAEPVAVQHEYVMPEHLVIVGDSIMAGSVDGMNIFRSNYRETTAHRMAEVHNMRTTNLSLSGQNMHGAMVVNDITGGINYATGNNSAVWVQLGANDFIWGFSSPDQYRARYTALLEGIVRKSDDFQVFCAVPLRASYKFEVEHINPFGYGYEAYRQVVRDIAATGLCTLVETDGWFTEEEAEVGSVWLPDGLHLSGAGHSRYAFYMTLTIRY